MGAKKAGGVLPSGYKPSSDGHAHTHGHYSKISQADWLKAHSALKQVGSELKGPCPVCSGKDRFYVRENGHFFCRKCCPDGSNSAAFKRIVEAVGLAGPKPTKQAPAQAARRATARPFNPPKNAKHWLYRDDEGKPVLGVWRSEKPGGGKTFKQARALENGKFQTPIPKNLPLYDLPAVLEADWKKPVVIVEGEKCADALKALGYVATTWAGGSGVVKKTDFSALKGRKVVLWPDNDEPGRKAMKSVSAILRRYLCAVGVVAVPKDKPEGWDVAEASRDEAQALIGETKPQGSLLLPHQLGNTRTSKLRWIADEIIPAKKATLLVGRKAIGKSTMAFYIAACVSRGEQPFTGKKLPDGPHRVAIYSAEDDWSDTVAVRLSMMEANMDNIAPLKSQRYEGRSFDWKEPPNRNKKGAEEIPQCDLELLWEALGVVPFTLFIIDPIMNIVTRGSNNDPRAIRSAFEEKLNPIMATGAAILGVHHERKDARREEFLVDRAVGSQAWPGLCRTALHMQALPMRKAVGTAKNSAPRKSLDGKFSIADVAMNTNSSIAGVICVSSCNLAEMNGGWHYELPTSTPDGQSSSFTKVAINPKKIKRRSAEELIQMYNPLAESKPPESAVNKKARMDMHSRISSLKAAEAAVRQAFSANEESEGIPMKQLTQEVMEAGGVGERTAQDAIRALTVSSRDGKKYTRNLKVEGSPPDRSSR